MKNIKTIAVLVLPFLLGSCASLLSDGMTEEQRAELQKEFEEKENAVQYPYESLVVYQDRFCKLTFNSSDELTLLIPELTGTKEVKFSWTPGRELRTWKRQYRLMQVCGVELNVVRKNDLYSDRLQICRKGNFLMEIKNHLDWRTYNTSRATINEFFQYNVNKEKAEGTYDKTFDAVPTLVMENWDYEQEEKAKKQSKEWH